MKSVLVVGHGLAGAILAQSLLQKGFHVQCMDADIQYSASSIAAGLINPFIGPKLNQPEDFDQCIQANLSFFKKWERETGEKLLRILDFLEDVDDVQEVHTNAEFPDNFEPGD